MSDTTTMEQLVSLCKRRGFVYPASEIYGGINGFWDYGPLGIQLKNNVRDAWWRAMVECPPIGPDGTPIKIVGLDSSIIQNPKVWEASGHVGGFNDPMVDCKECKSRFRSDHVAMVTFLVDGKELMTVGAICDSPEVAVDEAMKSLNSKNRRRLEKHGDKLQAVVKTVEQLPEGEVGVCPKCGGELTEPRMFNLMFDTYTGAIRDEKAKTYLRPETAQGIFLNYKNVLDTMRVKMPFGIAQVGKAFRNEVTPRNFIFRSREFEQMEMEWFCAEEDVPLWYEFWKAERMKFWRKIGLEGDNLIFRDHDGDELAHYSKACVDIEYRYPFTAPGFGELEGIAHRGCFDLTAHQEHSNAKMEYFDQPNNRKFIPHVIEPASGLTRGTLALLCEAFTLDEGRASKMFMKFKPSMAPIKAAVLPLVAKDGMPEVATQLYMQLREKHMVELDIKQSIGKRYARQDEIGTPYCFTIDGDTLDDNTVTVRHRDTLEQERIPLDGVAKFLDEKITG
jgi:glycyl-tRNA synthetase